jgi:hypothetical protein
MGCRDHKEKLLSSQENIIFASQIANKAEKCHCAAYQPLHANISVISKLRHMQSAAATSGVGLHSVNARHKAHAIPAQIEGKSPRHMERGMFLSYTYILPGSIHSVLLR